MQSTNVYKKTENERIKVKHARSEDTPDITTWEIRNSLKKLKSGKAAGEDAMVVEIIKAVKEANAKSARNFIQKYLQETTVPEDWNNASMIL